MKLIPLRTWVAAGLLVLGVSTQCTLEDCVTTATDMATVRFVKFNNRGQVVDNEVIWDSVFGIGAYEGLYASDTASEWELPPNALRDTSTFVFARYTYGRDPDTDSVIVIDIQWDTLALRYSVGHRVVGAECGAEAYFRELEITHHTFDSARVVDSALLLTNTNENITIYQL